MPAAARLADLCAGAGILPGRPNIEGSPNVFINDRPAHRVGDVWAGNLDVTATGSSTVFVNGQPLARVGDLVSAGGVIATGSGNVSAGG